MEAHESQANAKEWNIIAMSVRDAHELSARVGKKKIL